MRNLSRCNITRCTASAGASLAPVGKLEMLAALASAVSPAGNLAPKALPPRKRLHAVAGGDADPVATRKCMKFPKKQKQETHAPENFHATHTYEKETDHDVSLDVERSRCRPVCQPQVKPKVLAARHKPVHSAPEAYSAGQPGRDAEFTHSALEPQRPQMLMSKVVTSAQLESYQRVLAVAAARQNNDRQYSAPIWAPGQHQAAGQHVVVPPELLSQTLHVQHPHLAISSTSPMVAWVPRSSAGAEQVFMLPVGPTIPQAILPRAIGGAAAVPRPYYQLPMPSATQPQSYVGVDKQTGSGSAAERISASNPLLEPDLALLRHRPSQDGQESSPSSTGSPKSPGAPAPKATPHGSSQRGYQNGRLRSPTERKPAVKETKPEYAFQPVQFLQPPPAVPWLPPPPQFIGLSQPELMLPHWVGQTGLMMQPHPHAVPGVTQHAMAKSTRQTSPPEPATQSQPVAAAQVAASPMAAYRAAATLQHQQSSSEAAATAAQIHQHATQQARAHRAHIRAQARIRAGQRHHLSTHKVEPQASKQTQPVQHKIEQHEPAQPLKSALLNQEMQHLTPPVAPCAVPTSLHFLALSRPARKSMAEDPDGLNVSQPKDWHLEPVNPFESGESAWVPYSLYARLKKELETKSTCKMRKIEAVNKRLQSSLETATRELWRLQGGGNYGASNGSSQVKPEDSQ